MDKVSPLAAPQLREELRSYLSELAADDPRAIWQQERQEGLSSGIDEVFHFFFDDHDFDKGDVGVVFFDPQEVAAVGAVKQALDAMLKVVGDKSDDDFVVHRLWVNVTTSARAAQEVLAA
ncbi:hypothetical protein GCM10023219_09890 [Stakelama sediminis]|uniref:Uncharacterized protein n=1 Tax=Stakelama sediminis TaxID=463200 RepID=A0A840YVI8_9SPHN|nr:hypothetical protein [Stakelama sediminis]MBB5717711.1 hypothetical protein [Stakelama sediminis]